MIRPSVFAFAVLAAVSGSAEVADAAEPGADGADAGVSGGATLDRCLDLADRNHPNLLAERARLGVTRAQLREAQVSPFTRFRAQGGVGLAPTVRGDNLFSPNTDQALTSNLGLAWRFDVQGVVPLWTFGKITSLWDAAEAAVKVSEQQVQITRDEVRYDVRKAYYGLLLAREATALLKEAQSRIDTAAANHERQVENDEGDPIDLLKLQTYQSEIRARAAEAEKFERVAQAGLRFYTGVATLQVKESTLELASHHLGDLAKYLAAARLHRPEVQQARAGLDARQAQVKLAQAQLYPDIGIGLSLGALYAPEVANQINPFVTDPGNAFRYGVGVVFQWNLDFLGAHARVEQAQAHLQEMVALDRKALGGVAAEVEAAYADALDWRKRLDAFAQAEKHARKWLVTVQQAIDVGTMEEKDLVEPARRWAENRYNRLNATMEYNIALARLARATGWDAIASGG